MISQSPQIDIYVLMNYIYPLNSIYITTENITEAQMSSRFGGTWTKIKDRFLLASGDTYTSGNTGGEASHTLTTSEMPSHTHTQESHLHTFRSSQSPHYSANVVTGSNGKAGYPGWVEYNGGTAVYTETSAPGNYAMGSATPTINATGGSSAHNNMPPYLVVNVFKRTALYSA